MSNKIVINANTRNDLGKGASRRLRRNADLMPAILYGAGDEPQNLSIAHKDMLKLTENEAFFASVLELQIDGKATPAILKDMQRHPAKAIIMHADFQRVDMKKKLHISVPLHFTNEEACVGVKLGGGRIQHSLTELEVTCLPTNLPEYIEVDMAEVELGDILHLSDLKLPEGVESVALSHGADHDNPVASVVAPKGGNEDDELDEAAAPEAAEGGEDAAASEGDSE